MIVLIAAVIAVWTIWGNVTVGTTVFEIRSEGIPDSFDGFRIAQISDLHNAEFGDDNSEIIRILKENQPDLIVITGDLVDSDHTDIDTAVSFVRQAATIAPCCYVAGNHEAWLGGEYERLEELLGECGVTVLHSQAIQIDRGGECIQIIGIDDPDFADSGSGMFDLDAGIISAEIEKARAGAGFKVLLSHRPEVLETYVEKGIDIVLCGHAHGGQFRLPFIGGLIAPDQGLFPRYDGGVYYAGDTAMVVSRGIGNSVVPVRVNNRPEIVFVVLRR